MQSDENLKVVGIPVLTEKLELLGRHFLGTRANPHAKMATESSTSLDTSCCTGAIAHAKYLRFSMSQEAACDKTRNDNLQTTVVRCSAALEPLVGASDLCL